MPRSRSGLEEAQRDQQDSRRDRWSEALDYIFGKDGGPCSCIPKVVFLDLHLPKINGLEVLRKLKGDERTRAIPVVVLTSSREDQDIAECYELGVNSYIVKPVEFDNFMHSVSELDCTGCC